MGDLGYQMRASNGGSLWQEGHVPRSRDTETYDLSDDEWLISPRKTLIDDSYLPSIDLLVTRAEEVSRRIMAHHLRDQRLEGRVMPCFPVDAISERLMTMSAEDWAYSCLEHRDCETVTNIPLEILIHSVSTEEHGTVLTMVDILYRRFLDLVVMSSTVETPDPQVPRVERKLGQRVSALLAPARRSINKRVGRGREKKRESAGSGGEPRPDRESEGVRGERHDHRESAGVRGERHDHRESAGVRGERHDHRESFETKTEPKSNRIVSLSRLMKIDLLRRQMRPKSIVIFGQLDRIVAREVRSQIAEREGQYQIYVPTPGLAEKVGVHESVLAVVWYSVLSGRYTPDDQARHCAWARATRQIVSDIIDEDLILSSEDLGSKHLRKVKGAHTARA